MAPQTSIPPAANVLGTIGTVFWCIQLVPQIWFNWKQKKTDGLPALMMFLWAISAVPFGVYAIIQNFNMPIQIQPQIFCLLSLVTWGQILHYNGGLPAWKATLISAATAATFGGVELVLILTLRPLYLRGIAWPLMIVGITAAILLAAGLLPPYAELWKRGGRVVGIHWGFLTIDWLGAFFSLMGVIAQNTFDPLGGCLFIVCVVIEGGIFVSHGTWLIRTRKLRAKAKAAGCTFDDLPESEAYHVDVPRKGSIAASRDVEHVEIERRGSMALARERDLEAGRMSLGRASLTRNIILEETESIGNDDDSINVSVKEVPLTLAGQAVEETDYGTMTAAKGEGKRNSVKRPGYVRQVTSESLFKDPVWGKKGGDE
ncbi:hypothetical protein JMJ35_004459 [Cladonia borealis]|uniref:PQ loop repeat protein n=1 Tax=Cladonia borealis TaxID=184061 RepID=A0AA39R525_9LECA|nr:hypothetical protein JMJ35_004459 [Cladonia borealis]